MLTFDLRSYLCFNICKVYLGGNISIQQHQTNKTTVVGVKKSTSIVDLSQIVFYRILCCKDEQTYKKVQILKTNVYLDIQLYIDGHNLIVIEFIIKKAFFFAKKTHLRYPFSIRVGTRYSYNAGVL